jgi:putative ABC transport system substrate-binding protein
MRRREFITLLGGAAATWPLAARAQQRDRIRRIGVMIGGAEITDRVMAANMAALRDGLQKLGWTDGRNIRIDYRAAADAERLRVYATELMTFMPDVVVTGTSAALIQMRQVAQTTPIVFTQVTDPVAQGFVASLASPGGTITGFALFEQVLITKRLELLKEIAPHVTSAAFVYDPVNPNWAGYLSQLEAAAPSVGVQVSGAALRDTSQIEHVIGAFAREANVGLIVQAGGVATADRQAIIALAARHHLPAVYGFRYFVAEGGLASYGVDNVDLYGRAASYVDHILKGEKPGDLPVQFPTKYELVINRKSAKSLGLDMPLSLLMRVDEVIE